MADIQRLRELHGTATPGPWEATQDDLTGDAAIEFERYRFGPNVRSFIATECPQGDNDAALIAAMRNALPALLDVAKWAGQYIELADHFGLNNDATGVQDNSWWGVRDALRDALVRLDGGVS